MTDDKYDGQQLLTHDQAAAYLQIKPSTLHKWNHKGTGPRSAKMGKYRRYRLDWLNEFIDSRSDGHDGHHRDGHDGHH